MKLLKPATRLAFALAIAIALAAIPTAAAQAQPPQCAYFIYTAQDYSLIEKAEYSTSMSTLFTITPNWDDQNVCAGYEISGTAPQSLSSIGNNILTASDSTFTAFVWNTQGAWRITPLAVEPYTLGQGTTPASPQQSAHDLPIIIASSPKPLEPEAAPEPEVTYSSLEDAPEQHYADTDEEPLHDPEPVVIEDPEPADSNLFLDATAEEDDGQHESPDETVAEEPAVVEPLPEPIADTDPTDDYESAAAEQDHFPESSASHAEEATVGNEDEADAAAQAETAEFTFESAWEALENHDYEYAAQQFTALTQDNINDIRTHDGLARARAAQGALTSATTALQIALGIDPDNYTINTNLGNLLIQTGKYQEAIIVLENAVEVSTDDPERLARTHANLALALQRSGNPERAAQEYEAAYNLSPHPDYTTRQYHALVAAGQTTSLIPELLTHAQNHPSTDLHLLAADIYHELGDHPSRDHQVKLALRHAATPDEEARALMYQASTNLDAPEAISQYEAAAQLNPNLWQAHYNAGILALNHGDTTTAVTRLQDAAAHTTTVEVQAALARAHLLSGNAHEALDHAQVALSSETREIRNYAALTALHAAYQLGNYSDVVQLESYFDANTDVDLLLILGSSHYQTGNYATAATQLQAAYAIRPTPALKHTLAFAYLAAYQANNALPLLQDLANENPMDGQLQHALGWAYQMTNNTIDSQLAFRRATALGY